MRCVRIFQLRYRLESPVTLRGGGTPMSGRSRSNRPVLEDKGMTKLRFEIGVFLLVTLGPAGGVLPAAR